MQEIHAQSATSGGAVAMPAVQPRPLLPWLELIAGFFGFHGVGLFFAGKRVRGAIWFILSLVKHAVGAGLLLATAGLALACLLPLDIGLSIYLALAVARGLRKQEHGIVTAGH